MKNKLHLTLPQNSETKIVYIATKLGSKFNTKDCIPFEHNHDLIYHAVCPHDNCNKDYYIGENTKRLEERVKDHYGRDANCHMLTDSSG